jgi:hypothetical protein
VANYLARNVLAVASAAPLDATGNPENFRCASQPTLTCGRNNDCPAGTGFCNHPGGGVCNTDADCGAALPCVLKQDCVPLILGQPVPSITGGIAADPLNAALLDGKISSTPPRVARASTTGGPRAAAPLFNSAALTGAVPGSVVSTSHDASYVTCSTCHADFGGRRPLVDFSRSGASLRNTMDLAAGRVSRPAPAAARVKGASSTPPAAATSANEHADDPAERARGGSRPLLQPDAHRALERRPGGGTEHLSQPPRFRRRQCGVHAHLPGRADQRSALTSSDPADVHGDLAEPQHPRRARGEHRHPPDA